jgi:hypothetical protein
VLGLAHAIDAVPGVRLGDGGNGRRGRFEDRDVRGLIPWTSLERYCVASSGSSDGEIWWILRYGVTKYSYNNYGEGNRIFSVALFIHLSWLLILGYL